MIGKISRVALREVWRHEAYDLTVWLESNIDVLNEALGLRLSNPERERSAGSFNIDIVAEDESGNPVIIENQLEKSNHDHLGKVLTYLVAMGAKIGIWIVADPRPEHISVISWLNESTAADFYLLKIEAIKIGDSPAAPLLTPIVGPSEEAKEIGRTKKDIAERYLIREQFWAKLLVIAKTKTKLHASISPGKHNWIGTSAGKPGLGYNYSLTKDHSQVELYIDRGKGQEEENLRIFGDLSKSRAEIEEVFGEPLDWQELEESRACRIAKRFSGGYRANEDEWEKIITVMIDTMMNFENAIGPKLKPILKTL